MPSSPTPGGSLGRTSGARLHPSLSSEALSAHPLLGSNKHASSRPRSVHERGSSDREDSAIPTDYSKLAPPSSRSRSGSLASIDDTSAPSATYHTLNYAPRQRPTTSTYKASQPVFQSHGSLFSAQAQAQASSTGAAGSTASVEPNGLATSPSMPTLTAAAQLQMQKLKAEAQQLKVSPSSLGWAFLERLQAATEGEWAAIAELAGHGEATLLLPAVDLQSVSSEITLSDAYDHMLVSNAGRPLPDSNNSLRASSFATLSGLRCTIETEQTALPDAARKIVFRSFVARSDASVVADLRTPHSRRSLLSSLAPLPQGNSLSPSQSNSGDDACSYRLGAHNLELSLPLPPWTTGSAFNRPVQSSRLGSESPGGLRSSSSLATLFGGSGHERRSTRDQDISASPGETDDVRLASESSSSSAQPTGTERSVAVWVVDRPIRRTKVIADMATAAQFRISTGLSGLPDSIVDLVCTFVATFFSSLPPPPPPPKSNIISRSRPSVTQRSVWQLSEDELSESVQDLFGNIRSALDAVSSDDNGNQTERSVDEQLELVEKALLEEIYDRIFCPHISRDSVHDEALSSRIAALNVLSLSLEHLGIQLPSQEAQEGSDGDASRIVRGLEEIITSCGKELQRLQQPSCHSPAAKLSVLVTAHKLVVDGLDNLPPIALKKEVSEDSVTDGAPTRDTESVLSKDRNVDAPPESSTPPPKSSTSSADLILPILIYAIVRSNPPQLTSHLLFVQRFRAESLVRGEASYCLVNIQAAVAFLENVEPTALGLQGADQVIGLEPLSPDSPSTNEAKAANALAVPEGSFSMPVRIRGRLVHEIGELAGVSNKVITGVLGSSMSAFGRMMGASSDTWEKGRAEGPKTLEDIKGLLAGGARFAPSLIRSTSAIATMGSNAPQPREVTNAGGDGDQTLQEAGRHDGSKVNAVEHSSKADSGRARGASDAPSLSRDKPSISDRLASLPMLGRLSAAGTSPGITHLPVPTSREDPSLPPQPPAKVLRTFSHEGTDLSSSPTSLVSPRPEFAEPHVPASLSSPYSPLSSPPTPERPLHVLIGSTGSVASVKIPLIVEEFLQYSNVRVQIISTKPSLHFFDKTSISTFSARYGRADDNGVPPKYDVFDLAAENKAAVRGLSKETEGPRAHLWTDEDEWSEWNKIGDPILHIELRRWADIVLIAPCSANTLSKLVAGTCDSLLTSFLRALSPSTPTFLFPAMNTLMYLHPLTSRHVAFVREVLGYQVVGPIEKRLACGDLGAGAMTEWLDIVQLVVDRFKLVAAVAATPPTDSKGGEVSTLAAP